VLEMMGDDLKLGDSTVHLTPSEAAILRLLVARRGEAVSREELRETLKGHGESNKLEVYLCFLRRKIERPLGLHMITTVRGVGYRLE
jgi:two-component system OmpR family response regulator